MENLLSVFIIIPLVGFLLNGIIPKRDEVRLSKITFYILLLQLFAVVSYTFFWIFSGEPHIYKKWLVLLELHNFELYIDFIFDETTAVFLFIGAFITFLVTTYSRNYLHREVGFKRFFVTILFFYLGYNIIVLSGNLTTIFIGWEIAGISSFLLIAYYRNRYIPVKNALKIFSIYRLGDIALILAMWLGHHIWHGNVSMHHFDNVEAVQESVQDYLGLSIAFTVTIFIASAIKSAQFPFSAWLPRAMEGPTPSSAIFYSSLAVHLGVFVLLRTYGFWIHVPWMQEVIITSGTLSYVLSTITARIQPSIKGQLAYATIAQVGVMAIEIALGWHILALIHFASHAMLRCYQTLISPSIVSYAIKKQFFEYEPIKRSKLPSWLRNISNSMYIFSLNEWYQDSFMYYLIWGPFKWMGNLLQKMHRPFVKWFSYALIVVVVVVTTLCKSNVITVNTGIYTASFSILAFLYILRVFTERESLSFAWWELVPFHLLIICSTLINGISILEISFYVGGIVLSFITGYYFIAGIKEQETKVSLHGYQGHCYEYPFHEFWFFVSCLGLIGFPITSAFIGLELILNNVNQYFLLGILLLSFLINGLAMIRMYTRIFLGPHVKTYHTQARKSS